MHAVDRIDDWDSIKPVTTGLSVVDLCRDCNLASQLVYLSVSLDLLPLAPLFFHTL